MNLTYLGDIDLNEETLAHYGVIGMRWGVRRDLKKTGSISKKTKSKIKKAVSKASYGKTRRMLNALEQTKSDYKGDKEYYKSKKQTKNVDSANRSLSEVNKISTDINKTAKSKGYKYNTREATRSTRRENQIQYVGGLAGGFIGSAAAGAATVGLDAYHRKKYKSVNSPYWTYDTTYYSKIKKKKK